MIAEFREWPKIRRFAQMQVCITEKIDGTNACVIVQDGAVIGVQSRSRVITPEDDNYGFATWVRSNEAALATLGDGYHYGEWAGPGIQKNPLNLPTKKFFLFNTHRWAEGHPAVCELVPVLYDGPYREGLVEEVMSELWARRTAAGQTPEGVVIYYKNVRTYEKHTFKTPEGKWAEMAAEAGKDGQDG